MTESSQLVDDESRTGKRVLLALALVLFAGIAALVLTPRKEKPPELLTVNLGDAIFKTEATGRVVPREEVFVRSLVSGQLVELRVRAGDAVKKGDHLATVRIIADPVMLGEARAQVRLAESRLTTATRELARLGPLKSGIAAVSSRELADAEDKERVARTELTGLKERLKLIEKGVMDDRSGRSTHVVATIDGVVLATPVAVGDFVSDMNSYRDGTTIAVLADMNRLLFKGQIEEAHVGKIQVGMPADVRVGALSGVLCKGKVAWISPRATVESAGGGGAVSASSTTNTITPLTSSTQGITKFELWVELQDPPNAMRAGYTASAELTLERRVQVPVIEERALQFEKGKVFVRLYRGEGQLEQREVQVGVSDGMKIEIVSGVTVGDKVALQSSEPTP